jgi:hypothetical protein
MSKKIQLSIPTPCHENWDAMTPVQQGKFCGSCLKQVIDFSNMSDRQVAEFFKKPSTGSVCGRFMTDQLDRAIEIPKKRIPWVKYFFQFVIPAFLVSIKASSQKTQGTVALIKQTKDTTRIPKYPKLMGKVARPVCTKPLMGDVAFVPAQVTKLSGTIQLKVVDEKGEPVSYASIETGVIGKGGAADKNGLYNLDKSILNINGKIFVSSAGYERKEVPVKTISGLSGTFTVELRTAGLLPEVVVTAYGIIKGKVMLGSVTKIKADTIQIVQEVAKKEMDMKRVADDAIFLVYPNPVSPGSDLNIELKQAEEGYHSLQLINLSGQQVYHQEIWIDAEARLLSMNIPLVAAGSYFLTLSNKKTGKRTTEKIIVQ